MPKPLSDAAAIASHGTGATHSTSRPPASAASDSRIGSDPRARSLMSPNSTRAATKAVTNADNAMSPPLQPRVTKASTANEVTAE